VEKRLQTGTCFVNHGDILLLLIMVEVVVSEGVSGGEGDFEKFDFFRKIGIGRSEIYEKQTSHTFCFLTL
jgi:hypothetical protein